MSEAARIDLVDRAPLTEKQQNVYESIMQYQRVNGYAPTIREICKMVGVASTSSVYAHLKILEEKGYMDNTANTKQAIKKETEQRYDGKAIAFIKSRKAEHKIHKMAEEMYKTAELAGVELVDVIVDDSANDDIDRREITDFCKTVDDTDALVVLVNNLFAFTTDLDDLLKFVETLMYKPVMILEMEHHHILSLDYSDDSEVDE